MKMQQKPSEKVWAEFQENVNPTPQQLEQFKKYANYLLECNQLFNLTAHNDLSGVARHLFWDSLAVSMFVDMDKVKTIVDIGTGAGFPGIPLKIMFPHLNVTLIEVTKKKIQFLSEIIDLLKLEDVVIYDLDWRTFLRTTKFDVDLFVTRAAINELELSRALKPACFYNKVPIAYWVSQQWEPNPKVTHLVNRVEAYKIAHRKRRMAFLALDSNSSPILKSSIS